MLVHFWMVFVVPQLKSPSICEECIGAIFRDSILTTLANRSSVGYLQGLPVDIDSILINGAFMCPRLSLNQSVLITVFLQKLHILSFYRCSAFRLYIEYSRYVRALSRKTSCMFGSHVRFVLFLQDHSVWIRCMPTFLGLESL